MSQFLHLLAILLTPFIIHGVVSSSIIFESLNSIPTGYTDNGPAPVDSVLSLRVALVQNNVAGLHDALYAVSDPSSNLYGQHLSSLEVEAFVAPTLDTVAAVAAWLLINNVSAKPATPSGDWLSLSITVGAANTLLATIFHTYTQTSTGETYIRTLNYSLPSELQNHVELVHPTVSFTGATNPNGLISPFITSRSIPRSATIRAECAEYITPACLQALYAIPTTLATQPSNQIAVSGFDGRYANLADLHASPSNTLHHRSKPNFNVYQLFLTTLRPDLNSSTTFTLQSVDGGINPQNASLASGEANFDTQYTVGLASGVPTTFIAVGLNSTDIIMEFLDIITYLVAMDQPPQVLTTSYGFNEFVLSPALATNLCNAYAQLGARGVSILFGSGDGGVAGLSNSTCTNFVPTFPSSCPFVTSVGATTGTNPEAATTYSSGGFSNIFTMPSYQSAAVTKYLDTIGSLNTGKFNATSRAFPDISAQGTNVGFAIDGAASLFSGTSCSTPIFSSVIALLNDRLRAVDRPPLGFLNPFLYANPSVFNDITHGSNLGCGSTGFPVEVGWDPVTGLGTPNFTAFLNVLGLSA
ncbi:hypothetical protein JAAARDRAFT_177501 [Jaapia argillacea MUCL 33604]|uniref:tripeptidyl-peptidase II n=1 Tax=Jaapia argillacea MUCL 33604 TaxID=933084 RepID=A0A067PU76_9AGAM|nr:hypothetical protein JAAARDRAFT_177501 [Jaapia argillacea MUCL 33604]